MKSFIFIALFLFIFLECNSQLIKGNAMVIVNDKLLHEIIPDNAEIEILVKGFEWAEGPLWLAKENKLIFSDIPKNSVFEYSEYKDVKEYAEYTGLKVFLHPAGYTGKEKRGGETGSNGLLLSPDEELILCQHGDRRISKMRSAIDNPKAEFETLSDSYKGKKLNSPNDAVFHKNGDLYFTDPPYGLELNIDDPLKELDFQGVYKIDKNGNTKLLTKKLSRPNGIAFSPNFNKLYVSNSDPEKAIWMVYDVNKNGQLKKGKVFFDATDKVKDLKGLPDGMKVHPNGWIFATGPGGVLIFTPEGKHLGTLFTGEATSNCAFNEDYSELFITADDYLLKVKLKTR